MSLFLSRPPPDLKIFSLSMASFLELNHSEWKRVQGLSQMVHSLVANLLCGFNLSSRVDEKPA